MKTNQQTARLNQFVGCVLAVCLPLLSTGCDTVRDSSMTGQLWDAGGVNRCLPAAKPNAKLYRTADHQDVLVTYDELREKNDSIRRRAFFFKPNLRRLEDRKKPRFVEPAKIVALSLVQIPEVGSTNASPQETILVKLSDDGQEFTLLWSGTDLGPYALPVYVDRGSETKRFFMTPLTATGDFIVVVVVVAVVAGVIVAYGYAGSGGH
jgi:hypothetical protein